MSIKFLIGVWACSALPLNADQLRVSGKSSSVSHSAPQDFSSGNDSANAQQSYDKADRGTSAFADSGERAGGSKPIFDKLKAISKSSKAFLNPSTSVDTSQLREQLLSKVDQYIAQASLDNLVRDALALFKKKDLGAHLQALLKVLLIHDRTKSFADECVLKLVQSYEDGWPKSRKTPAEVLKFMLEFVPDQSEDALITSNLCSPLLTYSVRYTTLPGLTPAEQFGSIYPIFKFLMYGRTPEQMQLFFDRAQQFPDGPVFVKIMKVESSSTR